MVAELASGRRSRARPRSRSRSRSRSRKWTVPAAVALIALFAIAGLAPEDVIGDVLDGGAWPRAGAGEAVAAHGVRVTDGDTFRIGDERVRVENIDTPELGDGADCLAERRLADRARDHAASLFAAASELRIARNGTDRYGRTLARVSLDGADFGRTMIRAGYAEPWTGRRVDWCGAR